MFLSRTCAYAMRSMLYLAGQENEEGCIGIRRMSSDLDIPYHFLNKIMQSLADQGLVVTLRGPRGGVMLSRPATHITLMDILSATDGDCVFDSCMLGLPECDAHRPCALHAAWAIERGRLRRVFSELNLSDALIRKSRGEWDALLAGQAPA